jgi:non-specific serine/threonine protein kinase
LELCARYKRPHIPLMEGVMVESLVEVRRTLDEDAYAAAWAQGRAMTRDERMAEALAVEVVPPSAASVPEVPMQPAPFGNLTVTEAQVLRLLAMGHTTKEIAAELVVAISTVDRHLTHIYQKLGVRNRAEAIAFALTHGLA